MFAIEQRIQNDAGLWLYIASATTQGVGMHFYTHSFNRQRFTIFWQSNADINNALHFATNSFPYTREICSALLAFPESEKIISLTSSGPERPKLFKNRRHGDTLHFVRFDFFIRSPRVDKVLAEAVKTGNYDEVQTLCEGSDLIFSFWHTFLGPHTNEGVFDPTTGLYLCPLTFEHPSAKRAIESLLRREMPMLSSSKTVLDGFRETFEYFASS